MKVRFAALALTVFASASALAAPPTAASVERLLELSGGQAMMDQMAAQAAPMLQQSLQENLSLDSDDSVTRRALELYTQKFERLLREEMSWARMKPDLIRVYQESFDQQEVDGMVAFYDSPAGRAVMRKMPLVMQKSVEMSQRQLNTLMPRVKDALEESFEQARREQQK